MEIARGLIIAVVLGLLAIRARWAWQQRELAVRVWRAIRPVHVIGAIGLLAVVLGVALALWFWVPLTRLGVGSLFGLDGNVIFAPIDSALEEPLIQAEQAMITGEPAPGVPWSSVLAVGAFLGALTLLFPALAHAEEIAFRSGWEDKSHGQQVLSALRFGMVHLVMLIPLGAAIAISVAGWVYGQVYVRAYRATAVPRLVFPSGRLPLRTDEEGFSRLVLGPPAPVEQVNRLAARRHAVFRATVWHTTFNTTVAVIVFIGYLASL